MRENQYIWFIVNCVLGVLFIIWGSLAPSMPLIPGDYWIILPGSVLLFVGMLGIIEGIILERRILKMILLSDNGKISMEIIAEALHMDRKQIHEIIVDLRLRGKLQASFDAETGEVILSNISERNVCSVCGELINQNRFCIFCGTQQIEVDDNS